MRSHITRIVLVAVVWLGIALYMLRPVRAETASNSFASWLNTVVKKGDTENLKQQLYKLKESEQSLNVLIQKASKIVSLHNEDFNLPLDESRPDSKEVYDLLLKEWNSFQTGSGMGKASIPQTIKSNFHPAVDKFVQGFSEWVKEGTDVFRYSLLDLIPVVVLQPIFHIIPLSGGTAIGAP